jgi:hypothetical protein
MADKHEYDSNVELWKELQEAKAMALTLFLALEQANAVHEALSLYRKELSQ